MPIHLIWGDDLGAIDRSIEKLIEELIDPNWSSINLSRLDGENTSQAIQSLEEVRTPPFGTGDRVILLNKSPFCNGCSNELANQFESIINLIPEQTHLILKNTNKPDGRLKTTRLIKEKFNKVEIQLTFQSRFGPQEWLTPYTDKTLESLPSKGIKNLLVICPGFASDCVETLEEINIQGRESFLKNGGVNFDLIPCLNDNPDHIDLFEKLVSKYL